MGEEAIPEVKPRLLTQGQRIEALEKNVRRHWWVLTGAAVTIVGLAAAGFSIDKQRERLEDQLKRIEERAVEADKLAQKARAQAGDLDDAIRQTKNFMNEAKMAADEVTKRISGLNASQFDEVIKAVRESSSKTQTALQALLNMACVQSGHIKALQDEASSTRKALVDEDGMPLTGMLAKPF